MWRQPAAGAARETLAAATVAPSRFSVRSALASALTEVGVPAVEGAQTAREDAVGLLMIAAEVEHALMAQYLYAAQSVRGAANRTIAHVAIQEMGHLVSVQNLLLALTGVTEEDLPASLHLGRDGLRRASNRNPLPLVFERLSHGALAKFVVVERPARIEDQALRTRVAALEAEVAALGVHPNPVFALYAAIHWIFQPDDSADSLGLDPELGLKPGWHLADTDFVDPAIISRFAAEPAEWGSVPGLIVQPVTNRAEALAVLQAIAAQGEGASGATESHFRDFLRVLDMFEAGQLRIAPLAQTPYIATQPAPEDPQATRLTDPYTVLWGEFFNLAYELLLLDLAWAYSQPRGTAARTALVDLCVDAMRSVAIKPLSGYLARRPLESGGEAMAGPPFGLSQEELPTTRQGFAARFADLRARQDAAMQALGTAPEFGADTEGQLLLAGIAQIDATRAQHLPGGA